MHQQAGASPFPVHFDGKRYFNPGPPKPRGFRDVLRWQLTSRPQPSPRLVDDVRQSVPPPAVEGSELLVTLVNHSTLLIQQRDSHVLTDPIWAERASPFAWIGPRRRRMPGVRLDDLPRIDAVLVSHNHYDHLDLATLGWLAANRRCVFVVPCGVGRLLSSRGIAPVHELDWAESAPIAGGVVHGVPARHFAARGLFDRDRSLWCGFVIETAGGTVYFAGDTGFGDHFAQIRARHGAPRAALLPIGAYEPRWFMSPVHMGPDEAIRAHRILGAKTSIAMHHGTFQLTDESIDTPPKLLRECGADDSFVVLGNGQRVTLA